MCSDLNAQTRSLEQPLKLFIADVGTAIPTVRYSEPRCRRCRPATAKGRYSQGPL